MIKSESEFKILRALESNPNFSQRELSKKAGISLGKTNYCLNALIEKGLIKTSNFKNSKNRTAYLYKLTPKGMEEKARVTVRFLRRKMEEFDALEKEIKELRAEVDELQEDSSKLKAESF
ncbi:MarR family EPS-associated transcriptional regulator [Desulfovermiculus halophilus]|uniref:MarR family EPS-associated transcriptional regulator n=1 Tax=Desulfovermiculus halophilus TaxID=339722 RepID=UPI00048548C0|nr:MarR family EPS-associated transcriptional regulator [Desulfovermiculus halophilus]